jgi:hypothetical protein
MLRITVALTLWTLQASAFAAGPTITPNDSPMTQMALSIQPSIQVETLQTQMPATGLPFQLSLPSDNTLNHPQKEDWLESDGQWRSEWLRPDSQVNSDVPQSALKSPSN